MLSTHGSSTGVEAPYPHVMWLHELDEDDEVHVGGKAANLGRLIRAGFAVPPGFVVSGDAFAGAVHLGRIDEAVDQLLADVDVDDPAELERVSLQAQVLVRSASFPDALREEIAQAYERLSCLCGHDDIGATVAVRSSAVGEDSSTLSFAGMASSYTNVLRLPDLYRRITDCWVSLYSPRMIAYRAVAAEPPPLTMGVVVQRMVPATSSGVAFSIDPASGTPDHVVIEAVLGQGTSLVSGAVVPDTYVVDRETWSIVDREVGCQSFQVVPSGAGSDLSIGLGPTNATRQKVRDEQVVTLARLTVEVEEALGQPQNVEFVIAPHDAVQLVQTRPITASGRRRAELDTSVWEHASSVVLRGRPASAGVALGRARVLRTPFEGGRLEAGEVLVAPRTDPAWLPTIRRACAIVTEAGGLTSHAAIISRELGVAAVVAAHGATERIQDGDRLIVDGSTGVVRVMEGAS